MRQNEGGFPGRGISHRRRYSNVTRRPGRLIVPGGQYQVM